jgi:Na+-transporting methylmalonyl-CoA/oxaloacetate decarboxylase beta subunit
MAPHLLGAIAVAAYSYMSLVPLIQPPIMKLLTTQKEREVAMEQLRPVTKFERVCFPIVAAIIISMVKKKKQGKSVVCNCGNCKGCAMHGSCHQKTK